ncbi:MAG: polysaccharide deacetylase family protein [Bacillota bacterium]|nr:polysaccharide deacetylase family protein [Bacillota bacterium]
MFILFISSRTKIISFLLLLIVIGAFFLISSFNPRFSGVEPGVSFLGQNMSGLTREEVTERVNARFGEWLLSPVDAVYNPDLNSIIPELWGYEVNLQETINNIMSAAPDEDVFPFYEPILPDITIKDYPWAYIDRGNPKKKEIALMINVAWGTEFIVPILDILAAEEAYGTFFVVGKWAGKNMDLLKDIDRRGYPIESHGHTDSVVYTELSPEEAENGLQEVNRIVETATGQEPLYFTPHKGEYSELVLEIVSRQGMRTVLWSIDTVDWMSPGVPKMKSKVLDNLHEGAIVLMHPTEDTVTFLKETIPEIKNRGFNIVTISQLLNPQYLPAEIE